MNFHHLLALTGLLVLLPLSSIAQTPPTLPPGTLEPARPQPPLPTPPPELPSPLTPPAPPRPLQPNPTGPTVKIDRIEILGNTRFSPEEIAPLIAPYEGKTVTFEQLLALRTAITDLYTSRGYTTSGAFLPPQDITKGVVKIQVIEGELEKIEITGLNRLREEYVRSRISIAAGPPLNLYQLESALQLLQIDPHISRVQAELTAGTTPGRSILILTLEEAQPWQLNLSLDNHDSPSVGSIRHSVELSHNNVLGFGDRLSAEYGFTEGLNAYNFSYQLPLNPQDGTLNLSYSQTNSRVIEAPFDSLGIRGNSRSASIGLRQPISRSRQEEFVLGLAAELRQSRTYILDDVPYSFAEGANNGLTRIAALRFTQEWLKRSANRVLALRSQFNLGLGVLGATVNDTGPDGRFVSWFGQFQWVESLGENRSAIFRVSSQLTPDSLLSLEQFGAGGFDTVRGYRQNQKVADNGVVGSLELRWPVIQDSQGIGLVQVAPFIDLGKVWNNQSAIIKPSLLIGTGLGVRWQHPDFSINVDWAMPLTSVENKGTSLQDSGLYFSIQAHPF